jgi:hypothetical protein
MGELGNIRNVTVFLPPGDKCISNPDYSFIIAYKFICDPKIEIPEIVNTNQFNPESCFNIVEIKTNLICNRKTENFLFWWKKLGINKNIFGVIFLVIGTLLTVVSDIYREKSFIFTVGISIVYVVILYAPDINFVMVLGKYEFFICSKNYFFSFFNNNNHNYLI